MAQAKEGDTVKVHYTGKLEDETVFDSSREREPLEFEIGSGKIIPGFESGVVGMEVGETKIIVIPPEEAYGPRHPGWPKQVTKERLPENYTPRVGDMLQVQSPEGENIRVMITNIADEGVTLDNHPLAGKALHFEVELMAIG
jgi:FKBP-type peptidyl-prolyl cis-trans isomerase 2